MARKHVPTCIEKCTPKFRVTVSYAIQFVTSEFLARWADHPSLDDCRNAPNLRRAIEALRPIFTTHFSSTRGARDPDYYKLPHWNSPYNPQPECGIQVYLPGQCTYCGPVLSVSWEHIARTIRGDSELTSSDWLSDAKQLSFIEEVL